MAAPRSIKSYVYPCDNDIARLLDSAFVQGALRKIAGHYYSKQIQEAIDKGIVVTKNSFPSLYRVIERCSERIVFPKDVSVVLTTRLKGTNALAVENKGKGVVFLSNSAVTKLDSSELSFMLGHEFGHIAQGNLSCHTIKGIIDNLKDSSEVLGSLLADMIEVPLNKWYQCSEYTADRAGLLCCGEVNVALQLLKKVQESPKGDSRVNDYFELSSAHPYLQHREQELRRYALALN